MGSALVVAQTIVATNANSAFFIINLLIIIFYLIKNSKNVAKVIIKYEFATF
jgi:hypothetical protein